VRPNRTERGCPAYPSAQVDRPASGGRYRALVTPAPDHRDHAGDDPFVRHSLQTSMYFPQTRLFVAGNPKAAGTTLRWWLLGAHGVDVAAVTAPSLWAESSPAQTVWDVNVDLRYTWDRLGDDERTDALESTDVLTVRPIRHPLTRTFSAWSSKYLALEPGYHERLPAGFPAPAERIASTDEVAAMFEDFVMAVRDHVSTDAEWSGLDVHFWPQHRLLARSVAGETILLRQESMAEGLGRIEKQLSDHGVAVPPVLRVNENVIPYSPSLISAKALAVTADLYADDFDNWNYPAHAPDAAPRPIDLDWLNDVRGRNRRYAVVHAAAVEGRTRRRQLEKRLGAVEDQLAAISNERNDLLASRSWRITAPLRWLGGRRPGTRKSPP
jgi:hypothetical protein